MPTTESVTRLYDRFTPQERVALMLEAWARADTAEAGRLRESCPVRTYEATDAAFTDRMELSFDKLAVVCIELSQYAGRLHLLHWLIGTLDWLAEGHQINA